MPDGHPQAQVRIMELAVREWGEGRPVVLLHGLFGAGGNFGTVAQKLAGAARVIALDLRNHGDSPHAADMGYGTMAADVAETLSAWAIEHPVIVGHSMGGKVAMRLALDSPQRVAGLVVADIAPVAYPPAFRGFAAAMRAIPLRPGLSRAEASAALEAAVPEAGVRAFLLQNMRFGAAPSWRIGLDEIAAALPGIEGWNGEGRYDGPTLVVAGGRSDYVRPEHRALFRALFPRATQVTLKGAGHWVHADDPTGFASVISAFLARV